MNSFNKQRFPKISFALFIIGVIVFLAMIVRIMLGASINLSDTGEDINGAKFPALVFPILVIGLSFLFLNLLLWFFLRKKGIKFMDLMYPVSTLGGIGIFIYFHIALLA